MLSRATCLVSNGNNISSCALPTMKAQTTLASTSFFVSRALLLMTSKANKLPLETEPVARDNNTILTLKPGDQTLLCLTQLIIVVTVQQGTYHYNVKNITVVKVDFTTLTVAVQEKSK